jgi:predicted LPLAT superfamily acyltransferase
MTAPWHARAEAGHRLGLQLVEWVARAFGRRAAHAFVAPIALYFLLTRSDERRASRRFLTRVLGRPASLGDCFRNFYTFARVSVDRVFLLVGGSASVSLEVEGRQALHSWLQSGRGCVLLGAHLGSFEACRQAGLGHPGLRLRILLDRVVNLRFVKRMEHINPQFARDIIDAAGDPLSVTLRIGEYLRAGDCIGWLGDRARGTERTARVDFLGTQASLPTSPFIVANLFKVPVFLVLAFYVNGDYKVVIEPLVDPDSPRVGDRDQVVREQVQQYADRLAFHAGRFPFNWFNFYEFWDAR